MITPPPALPAPPPGFEPLTGDIITTAFDAARQALDPDVAVKRLRAYYDPRGKHAGATFTDLLAGPDTAPDDFTAADLFSVTLLSVKPPKPLATRRFLDPGEHRNELLRGLTGLGDVNDIALADNETMLAMERFYLTVRATLGKRPWVTASKLCARKRPDLFPVRDNLTCELMGLLKYENYQIDWQVFRLFMLPESGIPQRLGELHAGAENNRSRDDVAMDPHPLRWLDALLWWQAGLVLPASRRSRPPR